jgi:hypothetical protein
VSGSERRGSRDRCRGRFSCVDWVTVYVDYWVTVRICFLDTCSCSCINIGENINRLASAGDF